MIIQKITEQQTDMIRKGLENTIKTMFGITKNLDRNKGKILLRDFTALPVVLVLFVSITLLFSKKIIIQLPYSVAIFCTSKETISFAIAILPLQ